MSYSISSLFASALLMQGQSKTNNITQPMHSSGIASIKHEIVRKVSGYVP